MKLLKTFFLMSLAFNLSASEKKSLDDLADNINSNEFKQMTSVVVSQNNEIIYEKYFNQGNIDYKHDMRSASKSLTSLALGFAIQDGLIDGLNHPIVKYFEDKLPLKNSDPRKLKITIQDLLTMSSTLECDDWNSASRGNEERMYLIEDWSGFILNLPVRGIPPWKKTPEKSKYDRAFSYCTGGVQVLTELVERMTKRKMSDYLQDKLFTPLAIKKPEFSQTPLGFTNGGGGARLTSRDWIKIGNLILNNGVVYNKKIINEKWIKESLIRRTVVDEDRDIEYGYLWWIYNFKINNKIIPAYAAAGNGGNYLFMIPELSASVVITSRAYNTNYMHQQSQKILTDYVLPVLLKSKD
ncbi:MAG: serine hydrolase [Alcanivoracaceae bacterium]|nr:serine hydrolase [Alcanivoracaceae bacterium]